MKLRILCAAFLLAFLGLLVWRLAGARAHAVSAPSVAAGTASLPTEAAPTLAVAEGPSELTKGLNSPGGDIKADLRILNALFAAYRVATRDENPVGENREITAALRGRNRLGFAFVPDGCPALNPKGELCDRWGTPFFFHQLSGQRMEIRSAGPDRKLWTADDQVLTP